MFLDLKKLFFSEPEKSLPKKKMVLLETLEIDG